MNQKIEQYKKEIEIYKEEMGYLNQKFSAWVFKDTTNWLGDTDYEKEDEKQSMLENINKEMADKDKLIRQTVEKMEPLKEIVKKI